MDFVMFRTCFMLLVTFTVLFVFTMLLTVRHDGFIRVGPLKIRLSTSTETYKVKLRNTSVPVLIFTYMRSGSTLTGDILQHHPGSFYVFEPLRYIDEDIDKARTVRFYNGTTRGIRKQQKVWIHAEMMYRWLTCDFRFINIKDLTSQFLGSFSLTSKNYAKCIHDNKTTIRAVKRCITLLEKPCARSDLRIVKTIRMAMESVNLLLQRLPDLKVIYLIRDPRGKLSSQIMAYGQNWGAVMTLAKETCDRMMVDTNMMSELKQKYPDRIRLLLYETLARRPVETSGRIFEYLNINFTNSIMLSIRSLTSGAPGKRDRCIWCSKRGNSRKIAYNWRIKTNVLHLDYIDQTCASVYKKVGYVLFKDSHDFRNLNKPLLEYSPFTEDAL
ncbi:carbohydrate sulfotransferase 1-like isoform X2 [Mizuhopecten yessoensis]|nr:carbohydrate sulfotransferase 1-like isoform X2 [Mizuhopecten yessoensis]